MIEQLRQLRKFVVECREELCGAIQLDLSRSPHESELAEIIPILGEIDLAIKRVSKWSKIEKCAVNWVNLPGKAWIRTRSIGNVLIIGAFNYPVILVIGPLIHAIAAGNRAVLKVSELCPNVGKVIAENIGRYVDDVEVVQGGADVTQRILNQRKFDLVFFTGSERVGKIIACIAAKSLTPVVLELGGKCPAVVDKSADLKVSAKRIAWSKWLNCGQTCTAVDYAIVHQDVYQRFVEELKSAFEEFSVYQDPKFSKDYARIISSLHVDRIRDLVEKSNVKIEYGGQFDSEQRYVSPTILGNVSRNSLVSFL
jgi:aldehyde dehydrogenase (NAD+)